MNLLELINSNVWKVVIERITVVRCRMDNGGDNGTGCFETEITTDTANLMNTVVARFRKCRDTIGESKAFVKSKAKVAREMGCIERRVTYFSKFFKSNKKKFSFRQVQS